MGGAAETLGKRFAVMRPHLNEFQRRLWLGAEAAELGPGGVAVVAAATGVAADTVRRGRAEAGAAEFPATGRSRRAGGGRKLAEAHDGELVAALEALVDPVARGDPMSPVRWTSKSTRALARALTDGGHPVSDFVVRRLLRQLGYSLQGNAKTEEGGRHADRDARFGYINDQAAAHMAAGQPVVSVDAKKKENVGNFKNGGREWRAGGDPERGQVHQFKDKEQGKVTPPRAYHQAAHAGGGAVGPDPQTPKVATSTPGKIGAWEEAGLRRHDWHPEWNYSLIPTTDTPEPH